MQFTLRRLHILFYSVLPTRTIYQYSTRMVIYKCDNHTWLLQVPRLSSTYVEQLITGRHFEERAYA